VLRGTVGLAYHSLGAPDVLTACDEPGLRPLELTLFEKPSV